MTPLHQSFLEAHKIPINDRYGIGSHVKSTAYGVEYTDVYKMNVQQITNLCQNTFLAGFYYEQAIQQNEPINTYLEGDFNTMALHRIYSGGVETNGLQRFIESQNFATTLFNKGRKYYKETS